MENGRFVCQVDDLPAELERDPGHVGLSFRPSHVDGRDLAHDSDEPGVALGDRYQVPDGPVLPGRIETAVDHAVGSVQRHQTSNDALPSRFPSFGWADGVGRGRKQGLARHVETPLEPQGVGALQIGLRFDFADLGG